VNGSYGSRLTADPIKNFAISLNLLQKPSKKALVLRPFFRQKKISVKDINMPSTDRASNWSVTINMKNVKKETADSFIDYARSLGWTVNGQLEKGDKEGTEHYQLHVKTPQVRFSQIKKVFPTAHIEAARNVKALEKYVEKQETRIGSIPDADVSYVTPAKLWVMIYDLYNTGDKDGWNEYDDEVTLYRNSLKLDKDPLMFFDASISTFIRQGYSVEALAVNPAIRSIWKKFYKDILFRSRGLDRQTDRQEELFSQEVDIPTYNADEEQDSEEEEELYSEESDRTQSEGDEDSDSSSLSSNSQSEHSSVG